MGGDLGALLAQVEDHVQAREQEWTRERNDLKRLAASRENMAQDYERLRAEHAELLRAYAILRRQVDEQEPRPLLGLATTEQLLREVSTRIEVHGPGLQYRTVGPRIEDVPDEQTDAAHAEQREGRHCRLPGHRGCELVLHHHSALT